MIASIEEDVLNVALLGTPAFRFGGRIVHVALPRNALRLLVYLLLEPGRHARERVAFTLWPDSAEAEARANLRRQLHLVQRALPAAKQPWLLADATTIGWNPNAPLSLDVAEFENGCKALERTDAALALYRGHLLEEWDEPWVVRRRDQAHALLIETLTALIARARARGDFARAIAAAQRLRELDPWREDVLRTSLTLRYETGDRAGALAEYDRFARDLRDELGVDPMPETQALVETLRADSGVEGAASAAPGGNDDGWPLPFVGRAREMALLSAAWQRVVGGAGRTLIVAGEAGGGKSRLIDEFRTAVCASGGRAMVGRTASVEAIPLQAFADALRSALPLVRSAAVEPNWLGVLSALVPQLRIERPELPEPPRLSASQERTRLFEAVATVLAALARVRPLVLFLEDLHWAGASTLSLFEYLARRACAHRLLIAATWRDDSRPRSFALADLRRRLEADRLATTLPVGRLNDAAIAELLAHFVDEGPERCAAIGKELYRRCDGNALFLYETLRACVATGALDPARRRWNDGALPAQIPLSDGLIAFLRERLDRLPPDARNVAEIAAIVGRTFSLELVRIASGIDERRVLDGLDRLIDERLVHERGSCGDYAFTHHLIRGAVIETIPEPVRRRRHRRVASVLEQLHRDDVAELAIELADHYDRADEPQRAAPYYTRAAAFAAAVFANHEALSFARRGLELSDDPHERIELFALCETLYGRMGERDLQRAAAVRLASLAASIGDAEMLGDALFRRVELERACGDQDAEREALAALAAAHVMLVQAVR